MKNASCAAIALCASALTALAAPETAYQALRTIGSQRGSDVLKHVTDAGILDVKRLNPILKRRGQFARGASKLLEEICPKTRVWRSNIDGLNQLFAM